MKKYLILILLVFAIIFRSLPIYAMELPNGYLKYGSRGIRVVEVQKALNKIGYHIYADGMYGNNTKSSILDLQRKYKNLGNDGIYGPSTKGLMEKLIMGEKVVENENSDENIKTAYLTFDDGPSTTVTPDVLEILDKYGIKATFFIIGDMAEKSPDLVKEIKAREHSIGNHSYSHKYDYLYKNMDNFLGEIKKTDKILKNILGEDFNTNLMRFPGGSSGANKQKYKIKAEELGYNIYDWNSLNGDSEGKKVPVDKLITRLKNTTKGQKELVVLMHDTYGKETTAQALPSIIDYLIDQGYSFKKLEQ